MSSKIVLTLTRQYCVISNPVVVEKNGKPALTEFGQVKILYGEREIRAVEQYPEPFPLYPGEELEGKIEKYLIITQNQALRLTAIRNFADDKLKVHSIFREITY